MELVGAFGVGLILYSSMIEPTKTKKRYFKKTGRNTYKYIGGRK